MSGSSPAWRVFDGPVTGEPGAAQGVPGGPASGDRGVAPDANRRLALAGLAGAGAIGAFALVVAMSGGGPAVIEAPEASPGAASSEASGQPIGELVADVAGAVVRPGLYRLATGARVGDAIDAAGGFSPRVDVDRVGIELNLAATLTDGQQVRVPSRDDPSPPPGGGGGTGEPGGGGSGGGLVNLNTGSASELDTLPGIGPVTAAKIIDARSSAPFRTVEELRERGLVGEKTFENLRALVTVD